MFSLVKKLLKGKKAKSEFAGSGKSILISHISNRQEVLDQNPPLTYCWAFSHLPPTTPEAGRKRFMTKIWKALDSSDFSSTEGKPLQPLEFFSFLSCLMLYTS